ncbi:hypothetical protein LTR48_009476, partial [Friedmanniomyces endolithicus]
MGERLAAALLPGAERPGREPTKTKDALAGAVNLADGASETGEAARDEAARDETARVVEAIASRPAGIAAAKTTGSMLRPITRAENARIVPDSL